MKRFVFIILFWLASGAFVLAEVVNTEAESTYSVEIGKVRDKLQTIEVDLARLSGVNDELGAVRREMSNALMQISNFLAVADRTLDAATASISAGDTATSASQSYLTYTAILLAIFSVISAMLGIWVINGTVSRTSKQLVKKLKLGGPNGESPIIDEIIERVRYDLYSDASETVAFVMKDAQFRNNLKTLVQESVKEERQNSKVNNQPRDSGKLDFD